MQRPQIGERVRITDARTMPYHEGPYKVIGREGRTYAEIDLIHLEHEDKNTMWRWPKVFPWDIEPWVQDEY